MSLESEEYQASLERDARRGQQAKEVLDNPIYIEAHEVVEAEIIRMWRESRDAADREQLHQLLGIHAKLRDVFEQVMANGETAAKELRRKQTKAEYMAEYSIRG